LIFLEVIKLDIIVKVLLVAIMLIGIIAVTGCTSGKTTQSQAPSQQMSSATSQTRTSFSDLDAVEAKKLIDSDKTLQIVDVREQYEFDMGHLPDATLIPVGQLESRLSEIDKTKPVLLYCATGSRSRGAAQILAQAGYLKIYNLKSGIMRWTYEVVR
jgi:rhodanese-related sulfurtransferase